jgi:hypothetical protein
MYRQYEDSNYLEQRIRSARNELCLREAAGDDIESLADLHNEICDLEERINFAMQDEEYDSEEVW